MADMEKLLDGLRCRATNFPEKDCAHCHYGIQMGRRWGCDFRRMTEDAIALLKEYAEMEKTYSQVLMETTGNLLSKTNYTLTAIMDCIREHYCDGCDIREELDTLLKEQEQRHRLEVHNIGNVDVPEGVTWEQFQAVMSGVVKALEHTDRGESWPYDKGEGRSNDA